MPKWVLLKSFTNSSKKLVITWSEKINMTVGFNKTTISTRNDAAASINFTGVDGEATIRVRRLIEGGSNNIK